MFNFAWSEIALIGVVALVLIGPKDMPVAIKAVANMIKKARRMAAEFQSHVDEMVRDTELAEIRQQINEIRNLDLRGELERAVDADGSLRKAFEDPFVTPPPTAVPETPVTLMTENNTAEAMAEAGPSSPSASAEEPTRTASEMLSDPTFSVAPAFIPPSVAQPPVPPPFIPPNVVERDSGAAHTPFA